MRALYINAKAGKIEEVDLPENAPDQLAAMHRYVGGYIEVASRLPNGDIVFVDEEGLLMQTPFGFDIFAYQPFWGNGLITGKEDKEGEITPAKTDPKNLLIRYF